MTAPTKQVTPANLTGSNDMERRVLRALQKPGCPLCRLVEDNDENFFFWFFNEQYSSPEMLAHLRRSHGFCLAHASRLVHTKAAGRWSLDVVYGYLTHALYKQLSTPSVRPDRAPSGPCPACSSRDESAARYATILLRLLRDGQAGEAYGSPGLLCFPHLQRLASKSPDTVYRRLLLTQEARAKTASRQADTGPFSAENINPLSLSVSLDAAEHVYPREAASVEQKSRDPVVEMAAHLATEEVCPICCEERRIWLEWHAYLEANVGRAELSDLLPTCSDHVWAYVKNSSPALAAQTVSRVAKVTQQQLTQGVGLLPTTSGQGQRWRQMLGIKGGLGKSRAALTRDLTCPLCARLRLAQENALRLLFALLAAPHHRTDFQRGYGLCLRHLVRALELAKPDIREVLLDATAAKLAVLHWELDEDLRKSAWQYRPEAKGSEQHAWRRAMLRFSGYLAKASAL
jgi:hypothetical protein